MRPTNPVSLSCRHLTLSPVIECVQLKIVLTLAENMAATILIVQALHGVVGFPRVADALLMRISDLDPRIEENQTIETVTCLHFEKI